MRFVISTILFFSMLNYSAAQTEYWGSPEGMVFTTSDYLYISSDTILIAHQGFTTLKKADIRSAPTKFSITETQESYGETYKRKTVNSSQITKELEVASDSLSYFGYKGEYGQNWIAALQSDQISNSITCLFDEKKDLPVVSYTIHSDKELTVEELELKLVRLIDELRGSTEGKTIIPIYKYDIEDDPVLKKFAKSCMNKAR